MPGSPSTRAWRLSKCIPAIAAACWARRLTRYSDIEQIWQKSWRMGFYRGGPVFMSALAGIDIALWDLKGEFEMSAWCFTVN